MILRRKLSDLFIVLALLVGFGGLAQIQKKIGTNANSMSTSAVLELESTTRGFLPPRMTHSQKTAISSPTAGLIVWCTNCGANGEIQVYNGVALINFSGTASTPGVSCSANVGGILKVFMCYNLGVTGTQDPLSYQGGANNGALYQWGRQTDGHEDRASLTQPGPVGAPVANRFITNSNSPSDWRDPQDNSLWLDASKTANDPCPAGFRVPTQAQWRGLFSDGASSGAPDTANQNTWTWTGNGFTVGSSLYLPAAGRRPSSTGVVQNVDTDGTYWSSTVISTKANILLFSGGYVYTNISGLRGTGYSVRCISE